MEIKFEGPLFDPIKRKKFLEDIESQAIEQVATQARELLEEIECPVHHKRPSASLEREPDGTTSIKFDYCCDDLMNLAKQALIDAGLKLQDN